MEQFNNIFYSQCYLSILIINNNEKLLQNVSHLFTNNGVLTYI